GREPDRVAEPRAQPRAGDLASPCGFEARARLAHGGGDGLFTRGDFRLHHCGKVGADFQFQPHAGLRSSVQISRSRSRRGSPWITWLSAPMTITSPGRGAGRSATRTSTTVVSLTKRPAPKSVTRSGARQMMRIGRSSDVVAEIQRAGAAME